MSKIILDITYLAHWHGNLTGIPRMINELAIRYVKNPEVIFVSWSNEGKDFFEIDARKVFINRGKKIDYIPNSSENTVSEHSLSIKIARRAARYKVPLAHRAHQILESSKFKKLKRLTASEGDVLLIPMGEWASSDYADKVSALHGRGLKIVQVIHDMLPLVTPQYSGHSTKIMEKYCKKVIPEVDLVLAVSQNTKKDLKYWLQQEGIAIPRIEVFRHGEDFARIEQLRPTHERFLLSGVKGDDFILCVGTVEIRKNHTLLYYTYKLAHERGIDLPKVIVVGRPGWHTEQITELINTDPETKDQILLLGGVSDEELAWLYDNCAFTIFPSFYEGWGIPIAESIVSGKPCISSNTSSMPEIAGDIIEYFSPTSTDECLAAISNLSSKEGLSAAKKRLSSYKPTSWEDTFETIDRLIREI
jgi:glycosyltransferase involved in cell wall biosynthesis